MIRSGMRRRLTRSRLPVITCSGIRTAAIEKPPENELEKPVVSAPTASIRSAIRPAGVKAPVRIRGVLLLTH